MIVIAYTDGSSDNRTGIGSFGYYVETEFEGENHSKEFSSIKYGETTNNRMELKAIITVLETLKFGHQIQIHSDSKYCIESINKWINNWIKKGILKTKKNSDLWERFLQIRSDHENNGSSLIFQWVKAHNGHDLNELADQLAKSGRLSKDEAIICSQNN